MPGATLHRALGTPIALYLLALAVRLVLIGLYPDPAYPDAYYYTDVARALHAGQGLNVDFIWIFAEVGGKIPAAPVLPIPSNGHWMPLASLVQVPFLFAFPDRPWAGDVPFAIVGALAAPMAWAIAREAGAGRLVAVGAGVLTAFPALMAAFMVQPDNFSLYQPLVIGALWLTARGLKGHRRSFAFAGMLVGLATLARNDGLLVGFVVALAFAWDRAVAWRSRRAAAAVERANERLASELAAEELEARQQRAQAVLGAAQRAGWSGIDAPAPESRAPVAAPTVVVHVGAPERPAFVAPPPIREARIPWSSGLASLGLFLLVVAPWWARQVLVFGSLSPSTASGRVLFIRDISEWDSITGDATLGHLLGMGVGALLWSRLLGFVAAATIFSVLVGAIVLVPFMFVGAWVRRRSVDFGPFFAYAIVLFLFSALVSAVHVPGGTFIHSAVALAPYAYILALEGVFAFVAWMGRVRGWDVARAGRVFVVGIVGLVVVLGVAYVPGLHAAWDGVRQQRLQVAAAMDSLGIPASDRVMSIDASGTKYFTGRGGVVLVNDPLETIHKVAEAYDIRWLLLEDADSVPAMRPVLEGTSRPYWIGAPVFTLPSTGETRAVWSVALYPVCTSQGDPRCKAIGSVP